MLIGVDFDNTIACYEGLFDRVAREWGLPIAPGLVTREEIRDHLNKHGYRDDFTRLQGHVYGPGLQLAQVWPGVKEFIATAISQGHEVFIVSHKTRHPLLGPPYDLRACALDFLRVHQVLHDEPVVGHNVFFEDSVRDKVQRAMMLKVNVFVDDLPEVFVHFGNEKAVTKILFNPRGIAPGTDDVISVPNWTSVSQLLLGSDQCV